MQIKTLDEDLCNFLRYLNQNHRLWISYSLLHPRKSTISYSCHRNNHCKLKLCMKMFVIYWAILTKLTDYVFCTHCYILRKFGQDRMTISYSCHGKKWPLYHIAAMGTIRCKLKLCMKICVIF